MEIKCEFKDVTWDFVATSSKTFYTSCVTYCNITNRGSAVAVFKGEHNAGNINSVKALWFKDTKVHYIPKNLTKIFPNLVYLSIYNCELKEVSADDLIGLEKLEGFYLRYNNITTLPEKLFENMKNLKEVSFYRNLVQKFNAKILEPIKETIEFFGIQSNPGIDEIFNKTTSDIDIFLERMKLLESKKIDSQRLDDLFTSGKYSDFTIKVQDKEYKVHKNILASLSSVFDQMFTDDVAATSKTFDNVRNFSERAIEEFLRFFYPRAAPSKENATELLELAVEFDVPDLKLQCEAVLVQSINPRSARQLYNQAVQQSLPTLKRKAFEAIKKRQPEIADYIYDKPKLVNQMIDAKDEFQAKKIKLEKKE